jgi:cell division septation protein DedD
MLLCAPAILSAATTGHAQASRTTRTIQNAIAMGNAGQLYAARATIDSLAATTSQGSPDYEEIIFARATLASSALDAMLDYEKIIVELPSSARREESLLRAAQRSLAADDGTKALDYLHTMARDYPDDSSQAMAGYWMARVLFDQHDITSACAANREALTHAKSGLTTMRAQLQEQGKPSCENIAAVTNLDSAKPVAAASITPPRTTSSAVPRPRLYAVQVAAFGIRKDAETESQRLRKTGLDAHVDGDVRPFRVRIGHFKTRSEATQALHDLKKRKVSGFVTEIGQ